MPFAEIESRWQKRWADDGAFRAPESPRPGRKFYCLDMFPYPSAAGLHVGHPEGYTATDILCRYKRMRGFDVLHPMGWDAFGLPAENFAIATGTHPAKVTRDNVDNFRRQIKSLGFSYDWDREVDTTDPGYYKWTQWIFLQLFKKGLAYESTAPINFCPSCKTGLANEEVFNGACERCGTKVERKSLRQWVLRITAYADRLEKDLDGLDWPESTLSMQRHWIGRSEGAEVSFRSEGGDEIKVFTTRPDTLFGATYMVLAPEHALVAKLTSPAQKKAVDAYVEAARNKSDLERTELQKDKTGVFTGGTAINPVNGKKIPVWIADYVLGSYGTGAIMAVPAHDERDREFASKFAVPEIEVVKAPEGAKPEDGKAFTGDGVAVNSGFLNGLKTPDAKKKIVAWLEEKRLGKGTVNYKLRDWLFSRQRYWGEPIPVVHCGTCGVVPVPEDQLPVRLPEVSDYKPTGTGESPLAAVLDWVKTACPKCGGAAERETNTMPQWAGSCWYYLRFIDPKNDRSAWSLDLEKAWGPVDCYVGGAEHAVLHLLYARFWHKVLFDLGFVHTKEPFAKLRHQGMILSYSHRDAKGAYHLPEEVEYDAQGRPVLAATGEVLDAQVEKMSKSKKNVVNPDAVLKKYGADAFRLYEMFMGPFEQAKPWDMRGIEGVARFLRRVWTTLLPNGLPIQLGSGDGLVSVRHRTIKKVTEDIESFGFNTAISALMIYLNELQATKGGIAPDDVETLLTLLHPFAPHLTEELWSKLDHTDLLARKPWPSWDEKHLIDSAVTYAVQVNGKLRWTFTIPASADENTVKSAALASEKVQAVINGKQPVKVIFVPKKLVNFVVR
ncbi:MAG: leucine--tRNA ligase [Elusimicrobia bacterium]|nr:leucine--tRNA ligase [Elusimicrobiota bacterium]